MTERIESASDELIQTRVNLRNLYEKVYIFSNFYLGIVTNENEDMNIQ